MGDVVVTAGDTAAKNKLLGRVLSPLEIKELTCLLPGEKAMRHDEYLGNSMSDRFDQMGELIGERLKEAVARAEKHDSETASTWTPWVHRASPKEMIAELRRREHLNERVIAFLTKELAVHMSLSVKIRGQIRQAQATMVDEAMDVPRGLQEFIIRLNAAGLRTASVKDLSKGSLDALVAILHGDIDPDLIEQLGLGRSGRFISDAEAEQALEESARIVAEHHASVVEEEPELFEMVIEPVVPDTFDGDWDYSKGPIPPEYWSTVQEIGIPYEWEYRLAAPEEEISVLGMMLPEAHTWAALYDWDRHFRELAVPQIRTKRAALKSIRELLASKMDVDPDAVDMNAVKTWALLLSGRLLSEEDCDKLFEPGFFEGIVMPCPATGPGVVRRLVQKGV